jgi:hypothetical protein
VGGDGQGYHTHLLDRDGAKLGFRLVVSGFGEVFAELHQEQTEKEERDKDEDGTRLAHMHWAADQLKS